MLPFEMRNWNTNSLKERSAMIYQWLYIINDIQISQHMPFLKCIREWSVMQKALVEICM